MESIARSSRPVKFIHNVGAMENPTPKSDYVEGGEVFSLLKCMSNNMPILAQEYCNIRVYEKYCYC